MPHLNDLTLEFTHPHDDFYSVMKEKSPNIKVTTLSLWEIRNWEGDKELPSLASRDLAESLCSMPHLNDLTFANTHPHDDFYSVMKEKASKIKVNILSLVHIRNCEGDKELSSSASRDLAEAVCSMPHLNYLTLKNTNPHDDFYSVMKEKAPHIKITKLYLEDIHDYEGSKLSSSASRDLAEALCSMPHLNELTLNSTHLHDFYSEMREKAPHIKITKICLENMPDSGGSKELSTSASLDLVEAVCSMPHLNDLTLKDTNPHDDFYSEMREKASHIKITKLYLEAIPDYWGAKELSSSASRDLAEAVCSMPHLNDLTLNNTHPHDDFYSKVREKASHAKITTLCLENIPHYRGCSELSSSASRDLAEALCSMPHLIGLTLNNTHPNDNFYSVMEEKAPHIKITKLYLENIPDYGGSTLSSSASSDLAEALCSMPHLNDLTLNNTHPHDDFYSEMREKASHIKITKLYLRNMPDSGGSKELSSSASLDLVEAVCSMPNLNDLTLKNTNPHDDFYSEMREKASHIKITKLYLEDIHVYEGSKPSSSASRDLAEALCYMPHLNELTLKNTHPHDDLYSVMKEKAPHIKITKLCVENIPDYKGRKLSSSASRDLAEALCSMPHLNDFTLKDSNPHDDFYSVIEERALIAKGCFPQVAERHFRLNGVAQRDIHSLLNSFKEIQRSSHESSDYSKEEADNREEETHSSAEEGKGNSESGDEKETGYSDPADEESKASYEGDEIEDDPKEHEERNPEQSEEKSDDVRNDNEWTEDIKEGNHVEGLFDHQGGELSLETLGCILHIPPGALEEESPTKITLEVLTELPDDLELEEDEMVVSPGFKCLPSGKVERILQTAQTCRVHHNHFELSLEHFCRRYLTMFWDWLFARGKLMCYMPYLPNKMPVDRKPHVQLRLENKLKCAITCTKGDLYQPALDKAEEIMIERKDLTVNCEHDDKTQTKIIERSRLFNTTSCTAFFKLDLQDKDENTGHASVTLKLTQTITQEAMFDTGCIAPFEVSKRGKDAFPEQECAKRKVSEKEFLTLAKRIESSRYLDVGINLEIQHAELKDIKEGHSNRDALMDVFMKWRVKQPPDTDIRSVLADKLEEAGLQDLSGKLRNGTLVTS